MRGAYYNEYDPDAAAWLRELVRRGLIADGEVDERSILEVDADDVRGFCQCHWFAGIGGWSYALRLAGWPDDRPVWTGSPPCQPFSVAGKQKGRDDARHLAPKFISLVGAARPGMLFGEQVASAEVFGKAAKRVRGNVVAPPDWAWLDDLSDRLEAARYAVGASDFPSAGVGAPHIRQRTFFGAISHEWLADAESGRRADGASQQRSSRQVFAAAAEIVGTRHRRSSGRLENTELPANQRQRWDGGEGVCQQAAMRSSRGGVADGLEPAGAEAGLLRGEDGRMADLAGGGRGEERQDDRGCAVRNPEEGVAARHGAGGRDLRSSPLHGFWRDADWLFCRDGKWRPVEPAILGLVDGLPGCVVPSGPFVPASYPLAQGGKDSRRVVRLRGYGNAINPHAAAEFIRAFAKVFSEAPHD